MERGKEMEDLINEALRRNVNDVKVWPVVRDSEADI